MASSQPEPATSGRELKKEECIGVSQRSCSTLGLVSTCMGDRLPAGNHLCMKPVTQINSAWLALCGEAQWVVAYGLQCERLLGWWSVCILHRGSKCSCNNCALAHCFWLVHRYVHVFGKTGYISTNNICSGAHWFVFWWIFLRLSCCDKTVLRRVFFSCSWLSVIYMCRFHTLRYTWTRLETCLMVSWNAVLYLASVCLFLPLHLNFSCG